MTNGIFNIENLSLDELAPGAPGRPIAIR